MTKAVYIILLVGISLYSCSSSSFKNVQTNTTKVSDSATQNSVSLSKKDIGNVKKEGKQNNWWKGKYFVNNIPTSPNPEEGGSDFMIINSDYTGEFKVGDIAMTATWSVENDILTLNLQFGEKEHLRFMIIFWLTNIIPNG